MPGQDIKEIQVAFHEAPSCFSEEEWKLLQEWQKELYGNVMKEIHQALISLGPLITTTVFSLRAKEKQKQCPMDIPRSYGRHSINRSQSDPMNSPDECFIVRDAYSNNSKDKKGRGKKDCLSGEEEPPSIFVYSIGEDLEERATDPDSGHDIISFSMADKQEPNCMNHATNTKKENIVSPTGDPINCPDELFIVNRKEHLNNPLDTEENRKDSLNRGDPINCPDELFIVNRKEHLNNPLDTEENRKDSLNRGEHCHSREHGIISFSIKDEEESYCMDHKNNTGMESIHSPAAVPVITAVFSLSTKPEEEICAQKIKSEKTASEELSDAGSVFEKVLPACCESKKNYPPKSTSVNYQTVHTDEMHTTSMDCKKTKKQNSNCTQQKIFPCSDCDKSFSRKSVLELHQTIHTGEKPFPCSECEKSFTRKISLKRHQLIHTGDHPFPCTECNKSFLFKSELLRHQVYHTGEKPYVCTLCGKGFFQKRLLVQHQIVHIQVKPVVPEEAYSQYPTSASPENLHKNGLETLSHHFF